MKKSELLQWLQQADQQWQALLVQIGAEHMEQSGVNGDWSMKDTVAHLTGWHRHLVARLQAAQRGEPEPPQPWPTHLQTDDEINGWIYEANRNRPLRAVLDEADQVLQQLIAFVTGLPDDIQIEPDWRVITLGDRRFAAGEFFDHFRDDHEADVRAWLAQLARR